MRLDDMGGGALDYRPCRYGASRLTFRGPPRPTEGEYLAFLGGTETYGRFLPRPYPAMVETALGLPCVNLGCLNAGVDAPLRDPEVLTLASGAQAVVLQVTGAQNLSNRYYTVHPRRNDRFVRASGVLRGLFRDVDFTQVHFTRHLLTALQDRSPDRFAILRAELRAAWVARMRALIGHVRAPVVLLWFAPHAPDNVGSDASGPEPLFVDRNMLEELRPEVAALVEAMPGARARALGTEGMVVPLAERAAARDLPGPAAHEEAAEALTPLLLDLASGKQKGPPPRAGPAQVP